VGLTEEEVIDAEVSIRRRPGERSNPRVGCVSEHTN
jgi:hypothetical protein